MQRKLATIATGTAKPSHIRRMFALEAHALTWAASWARTHRIRIRHPATRPRVKVLADRASYEAEAGLGNSWLQVEENWQLCFAPMQPHRAQSDPTWTHCCSALIMPKTAGSQRTQFTSWSARSGTISEGAVPAAIFLPVRFMYTSPRPHKATLMIHSLTLAINVLPHSRSHMYMARASCRFSDYSIIFNTSKVSKDFPGIKAVSACSGVASWRLHLWQCLLQRF